MDKEEPFSMLGGHVHTLRPAPAVPAPLSMPVIEKGIPLPAITHPSRWPFSRMEIGDSFFIPSSSCKSLSSSAHEAAKRLNRKFTRRKVAGGIRVWRTA
jgi:hypothetical protein